MLQPNTQSQIFSVPFNNSSILAVAKVDSISQHLKALEDGEGDEKNYEAEKDFGCVKKDKDVIACGICQSHSVDFSCIKGV